MKRAWLIAAGVGCGACASVLGIPDDQPSYCSTNTGHTYCEDFDLGDPLSRMTYHVANGGAALSIQPSDRSPPNLIDFKSPALAAKDISLAGFDKEFDNVGFGSLHIEADLRIVTHGASFKGQAGFMIVSDKLGGCVGLAMDPGGIGAVTVDNPYGCGALVGSTGAGGDAGMSAAMMGTRLGQLPQADQWVHIKADVAPSGKHDGSGTFTFDADGVLAGYATLPLQAGTLNPMGAPLVGFSAAGLLGSGEFEIQYDNIVVDVKPP